MRLGKIRLASFFFSATVLTLAGCINHEEVWNGENDNPINVACGPSCRTLTFDNGATQLTRAQRKTIKRFVHQVTKKYPIYVSPCITTTVDVAQAEQQMKSVLVEVKRLGYTPIPTKMTFAEKPQADYCINLVRGQLHIVLPKCPNLTVPPDVDHVSSNFGCATNYDLALMIDNPWDLIVTKGDRGAEAERMSLGVKNLREGKSAKLDVESSSNAGDSTGAGG